MPGFLVQVGAQVLCSHAGQATPTSPNSRVTLGGAPSVALSCSYMVAGCSLPPPPSGNGPCVSAQWLTGTTRVLSNGQPLVVQSSTSLCTPSGTPLTIVTTQTHVNAQ